MTSDNIRPDFSSYANSSLSELLAETDRLVAAGDALPAYSLDFIGRCAAADDDTLLYVETKLRKLKDFRISEFKTRVNREKLAMAPPPPPRPTSPDSTTDTLGHMLNDHGNACRIRNMYGDDLRYCYEMENWLVWDGMRWAVGDIGQARQMAKQTMLDFLVHAVAARNDPCETFARQSLNTKSISSMLASLQSDIPVRAAELDTNPWLLNFVNGTVDLRVGKLQDHAHSDFITKLVHYPFIPTSTCPQWDKFLAWAMDTDPNVGESDPERVARMVEYMQRALGYSISGSTSEKAVFIPFGPGGNNGKSTVVTVIRNLVAEYSALIQVETMMAKNRDSSTVQEDLVKLRGCRFAQTSETEEGQKLSQGMLKRLTQGMGDITATRKYEHSITFPETHTLWIDTNKRPEIRDAEDKATFNRLHPIPFLNTIEEADIDRSLKDKLLTEGQGILAWLVAGAAKWYRDQSLLRPTEVDTAREEWHDASDQIQHFLEEKTERVAAGGTLSSLLYLCYSNWCDQSGEKSKVTQKKFSEKLKFRGFDGEHTKRGKVINGLKITSQQSESPIESTPSEDIDPPFWPGPLRT